MPLRRDREITASASERRRQRMRIALLAVGLVVGGAGLRAGLREEWSPVDDGTPVSPGAAPVGDRLRLQPDGAAATGRAERIVGETIRHLFDRADIVVHGTVRVAEGAAGTEALALDVKAFLRGGSPYDDHIRFTRRLRCRGVAQWTPNEDVVLFLQRGEGADAVEIVAGDIGKQSIPVDGWMPLAVLAACANGPEALGAVRAEVAALVDERGFAVLDRLRQVTGSPDLIGQTQLTVALRGALDTLGRKAEDEWPRAAAELSAVLHLVPPEAALPVEELHAVQPVFASQAAEEGVDPLAIIRATLHADVEWSRSVLSEYVDVRVRQISAMRPVHLSPADREGLRLLGEVSPAAASERVRALFETVPQRGTSRDLLELALAFDRELAEPRIMAGARHSRGAAREEIVAWFAPLLVRMDRAEARMLVRMALVQIADDTSRRTEFIAALHHPDAEAARRGLAAAFVEEAERFDNVTYARQAFFLRCHLASGGTLETFAGWLPKVLETPATDHEGRLALLRILDTELGTHALRWKRPSPADLDRATVVIRERLLH
jgi:hypothetical protein